MLVRKPIIANLQNEDYKEVLKDVEEIGKLFADYLTSYTSKNPGRSKHSDMGPVGKILRKVKTFFEGGADLKGEAIRIHQMTAKNPYLATETLQKLELGIDKLVNLVNNVPLNARNRVIERVGYTVYWYHNKARQEYFSRIRREFSEYLCKKYKNEKGLQEAWEDENVSFSNVPYPAKTIQGTKQSLNKKADVQEFLNRNKDAEEFVTTSEEGE
ncbi:hypothetical protein [Phosphitispora sp. TUW77]|uniref:hypothetical protein n=1 Tax=Phosphitispora sp. TUW77 TaxID=3152361 RepID=UPI003AB64B55